MNTRSELRKFEKTISTISAISRVFQNVTAKKMKINQEEVGHTEKYLSEAQKTYTAAKLAAVNKKKPMAAAAILKSSFRKPEKEKVLLLLASEKEYFGSLIEGVIGKFLEEYKKGGVRGIVLGRAGREIIQRANVNAANLTFYDLNDDNPDFKLVSQIAKELTLYKQILTYFGEYESVFKQDAKAEVLSNLNFEVAPVEKAPGYFFAPPTYASLSFLEDQLIAGRFVQKLYVSGLAKYGYRVKILQVGEVARRLSEAMDQLARARRKVNKIVKNSKQNQLFGSMRAWGQEELVNI